MRHIVQGVMQRVNKLSSHRIQAIRPVHRHHGDTGAGLGDLDDRHPTILPRVTRQRRTLAVAVGLGLIGLTACGSDSKKSLDASSASFDVAAAATTAAAAPVEAPAATEAAAPAATEAPAAEAPAAAEDQAPAPGGEAGTGLAPGSVNAGRRIIYTGTTQIETPNVKEAVQRITALVDSRGGAIAESTLDFAAELPRAVMTVKLPPNSLGDFFTELDKIGTVIGGGQQSQDVTSQIVDLDARILGAIASVERAREFLDKSTNIAELSQLEAQLTERETTLEQLRAQQQSLKDRVASATLTIELTTPAPPPPSTTTTTLPPVEPAGLEALQDKPVSNAFSKGWKAFSGFVKFIAVVFGLLAPFLAMAFLIVAPIVWWNRRRARRNPSRQTGGPGGPVPPPGHPGTGQAPPPPAAE